MVALVQALDPKLEPLSIFEWGVLTKLNNLTKPLKTKQLANRFNVSRPDMAKALMKLKGKGLLHFHSPLSHDEPLYYGWIVVCPRCKLGNKFL